MALAIGTRLREVDAKRRGLVLPEQLIHVDWDERDRQELPDHGSAGGWMSGDYKALRSVVNSKAKPCTAGQRQKRVAEWREQTDAETAQVRKDLPMPAISTRFARFAAR